MHWPLRGALAGFGMVLVPFLLNVPAATAITGVFGVADPVPAALAAIAFGVGFGMITDFTCTRLAGEG